MAEKRPVGTSGIEVAPLALGGNVFGWTADEATSFRILDAFVESGGTMIDTVLLLIGRAGMILLVRDFSPPLLKNSRNVVSVALVVTQVWLNLRTCSPSCRFPRAKSPTGEA